MSSSPSLRRAEDLYETFHAFEPTDVGRFHRQFRIPRRAALVGRARTMYYASDKLNPETLEDEGLVHYYHDHEDGVRTYLTPGSLYGDVRRVPSWIYSATALVRLGACEGLEYEDPEGVLVEMRGAEPLPEWYCLPNGRALLVVQDMRDVLVIVWGGQLRVEDRGVVG